MIKLSPLFRFQAWKDSFWFIYSSKHVE